MLQVISRQNLPQSLPALLCVLALYIIAKGQGPHHFGQYFSGILAVYTMFVFFIFGPLGKLIYYVALFWVLFKIGGRARTQAYSRYLSAGVVFVVILDLIVYQFTNSGGVTAMGLVLQHGFDWYGLLPLAWFILAASSLVSQSALVKSTSSIFATTFILFCTVTL